MKILPLNRNGKEKSPFSLSITQQEIPSLKSIPGPRTLITIAGPTAVGKTACAIQLARSMDTVILSADSRQFYRELNIGTAKPSAGELESASHYFIGNLSIHDYYNISRFEADVLALLNNLFRDHSCVLMVGGSGLYLDAVCKGIDDFPDPDPQLRAYLKGILEDEGIEKLRELLSLHDPDYLREVDPFNPNRIIRALEVCLATGTPYSRQRSRQSRKRDFNIIKIGLNLPRAELFSRINQRVDQMMADGLLEEAHSLLPFRHLNALNTVGYKELFEFFDEKVSLEQAVENIKTNTRRYAKRQLTWFKRDKEITWFEPGQAEAIREFIESSPKHC